jgi:hypothetical protein
MPTDEYEPPSAANRVGVLAPVTEAFEDLNHG